MDTSVIVALPTLDDKTYRISSEPVPHLTLVYISNEGIDMQHVIEFVAHASAHLSPFALTVDHRGTLGSDEADVLFFEDNAYAMDMDRIKDFRHHLLLGDEIRRGYDKAEQFPQWTPHLTLGYPEKPAHKDTDENPGIRYVHFDRIAVWNGNSEGPEFRLNYENHAMEVAMSDMRLSEGAAAAEAVLAHYGVKGMKWGYTSVNGTATPTGSKEKASYLTRGPKDAKVTQRKAGTYVQAKGGQRQKAATDAVRSQAARQIAKKSTTDALSTKELKDTIERMRLEQEFAKLDKKVSRKGSSFISKVMASPMARRNAEDLLKKAGGL